MTKTVLVTGAAGIVGSEMRSRLRKRYRLRLTDLSPVTDLAEGETFEAADLGDLAVLERLAENVDAIIHLGGISAENSWDRVWPANFIGTYNIVEAARRGGVTRIIYASSNHVVGFYPRTEHLDHTVLPRPDGRYGLSKVFGESLCRLYFDKYGMEFFCVRLGAMTPEPVDVRRLSMWIHADDLAELFSLGIDIPALGYEIVYGVSDNERSWWDNSNALRLGYRPKHRSEDYAPAVIAREPPGDMASRANVFQGGAYVVSELISNPASVTGR